MTTETTAAPAAPAATPTAPAATAAPAAPAPAAAESLYGAPPDAPAAPAAANADGEPPAWLPEKFRVMAEGKLDLQASAQKLASSYAHAEKRIGSGDLPPEAPDAYAYTPPEDFKDLPLDAELSAAFKERAHKAGLTQSQYEMVMGEYFRIVPAMMEGRAAVSAADARAKLQEVWKDPGDYQAQMGNAQRFVTSLPEGLRAQFISNYGTDPVLAQVAAHFGREMREDRPAGGLGAPGGSGSAEQLMASEAYRNPKHVDHARVSAQVADIFRRQYGANPVTR